LSFFTFKTSTPTGLDFDRNYVLFIHKIELIFFLQTDCSKGAKEEEMG